jgi:hypothetical protein
VKHNDHEPQEEGVSSLLNWMDNPWVGHAANVAQLVGIPLAVIALGIAAYQFREAARTAKKAEIVSEAQAVLALDQVLSQQRFEDLRATLAVGALDHPSAEDEVVLRRYVAAFERLGLLVDNGVMSAELAKEFYGSRLEKLVNVEFVRDLVTERENRTRGRPAWRNFIILWSTMEKLWNKDKVRLRHEAPSIPQREPRGQEAQQNVAGTS